MTEQTNGVPATYDFRRPYGTAPAPRYRPPPENSPRDDFSPEPYERRPLVDAPAASRNAHRTASRERRCVSRRSRMRRGARCARHCPRTWRLAASRRRSFRSGPPPARRPPAFTPVSGEPGRNARMSYRLRARSLDYQFGAAGGDALVRGAGRRDHADFRLFLPRHERQPACEHLRARLRQCARHLCVHARRRPQDHGEERLEGLARGARLSARRASRRLRSIHHGAGAGLERLSL